MNSFETDKGKFWLLPVSIVMGIGSCYVGISSFGLGLKSSFFIGFGIFMGICIPIYAWSHQMKIEINHIERYIEVLYPVLKRNIHLKYEQIEKIYIRNNINAGKGMTYHEITIVSDKHKVNIKSNGIKFFSVLKNKIKHEFRNKVKEI